MSPTGLDSLYSFCRWAGCEPATAPYGTNASDYGAGMMKACVIMGPGSIDQAHQSDEWVTIAELHKMRAILARWWRTPPHTYAAAASV